MESQLAATQEANLSEIKHAIDMNQEANLNTLLKVMKHLPFTRR